jgi:5-enolpyruvylshikimate-3-phosphate synthase
VLTGDASLRRRPMDRVLQPLAHMGARVDGRAGGRFAPVTIRGGDLQMLHHALPIASAQVKSALLLAGLGCGVAVKEPRPSRDHTERMLARMGATLRRAPDSAEPQRPRRARRVATDPSQVMQVSTITGSDWLVLLPTDRLAPLDVDVPGDLSSAAFFLVAAAIVPGSDVRLRGVGVNPTRAGVIDALRATGAQIDVEPHDSLGAEPTADLRIRAGALHGTRIGGDLSPDDADALAVYVAGLRPPSPPPPLDRDAVDRGAAAFARLGCAACHALPRGTDGQTHAMFGLDATKTPPLSGLAWTAPYLHDGRAADLDAVVDAARRREMGDASSASDAELADLVAGLRTR